MKRLIVAHLYPLARVYWFSAQTKNKNFNISPDEIAEARWFLNNSLPENMMGGTKKTYSLYISNSRE